MLTKIASCAAGGSACDNESTAQKIDQRLEELKLHPITQKSRVLGSLYYLRSGDILVFESSQINREIQLLLGDIIVDEYGTMISK